jgi:hypothetical protein
MFNHRCGYAGRIYKPYNIQQSIQKYNRMYSLGLQKTISDIADNRCPPLKARRYEIAIRNTSKITD